MNHTENPTAWHKPCTTCGDPVRYATVNSDRRVHLAGTDVAYDHEAVAAR